MKQQTYNVLVDFHYGSAWIEVEAENEREAELKAIDKLSKSVQDYGGAEQIEIIG
jgi:hypothetical protein